MSGDGVKIVKIGGSSETRKAPAPKRRMDKKPKFGVLKGGKTARKTPRFEAVSDPAKAPPMKKSNKLRILTSKGEKTRRATILDKAKKMPIHKIRETLRRHGIPVKSDNEKIARAIYADAQEAGMINDI